MTLHQFLVVLSINEHVLGEACIFDAVAEENRRKRVKQLAWIHHQAVVGHLYLADDLPLLRVAEIIQMSILLAINFIAGRFMPIDRGITRAMFGFAQINNTCTRAAVDVAEDLFPRSGERVAKQYVRAYDPVVSHRRQIGL